MTRPSAVTACQVRLKPVKRGLDVAVVYRDDISGAKPITSRPEGGELRSAINSRQINTVIVYQVDRLSRDIVDLLTTVRDWLRAGVEVYALDIGQVISELDIVLVIKGWQGGDERQKIRERTMRGRAAKAKAGKVIGEGVPPYGYKYGKGELLINQLEAQTVQMIYDWYVNGDESGGMMSLIDVAKRLTERGVPTPAQSKGLTDYSASHGTWFYTSVNRILSAETYAGTYRWGRSSEAHDDILINVPALVSRETWQLAQARIQQQISQAENEMRVSLARLDFLRLWPSHGRHSGQVFMYTAL